MFLVNGIAFLFILRASRRLDEAQERMRQMATTDALTAALNRGAILARARKEISRIDRQRERNANYTLSLIMLDIDHFKAINDTFGHLAGDQVLREVCSRIRSTLRGYDLLGRYGGEEFLIVLPDAPTDGALAIAERVRQAIQDKPFVFQEALIKATASLGVTTIRDGEQDLSRALQRADSSLFLAKEGGRNAVASAERERGLSNG